MRTPLASLVLLAACSEPPAPLDPPTLETDARVTFATLYASGTYPELSRPWIPVDVAGSAAGSLFIVQRMERDPRFDDTTECVLASQSGAANDCMGLQGSTVQIDAPTAAEPAIDGATARLVVDYNAWHFMRRPSAIAFGDPALELDPADFEGATDPDTGLPLFTEPLTYPDTFATCHEHHTGNFTDQSAFIGPTLWTADPAIYTGMPTSVGWQNGSHLDMVHATPYCVGLAYDAGANLYWAFNGELGTIDRYDFNLPHVPGHYFHDDAEVIRYDFGAEPLARLPNVPSNLETHGAYLYVADTGNGRVVRFDRSAGDVTGSFRTHEGLEASVMTGMGLETVLSTEALAAAWGGPVEPSGLAFLGDTLVVGSHGTGHLSLVAGDGTILRTIDTGLGAGLGGVTVIDGVIYFAHLTQRRVYRVDVDTTMRAM